MTLLLHHSGYSELCAQKHCTCCERRFKQNSELHLSENEWLFSGGSIFDVELFVVTMAMGQSHILTFSSKYISYNLHLFTETFTPIVGSSLLFGTKFARVCDHIHEFTDQLEEAMK